MGIDVFGCAAAAYPQQTHIIKKCVGKSKPADYSLSLIDRQTIKIFSLCGKKMIAIAMAMRTTKTDRLLLLTKSL
jgi:hypothetical protein